jgi:hypothetical protein
VFDYLPPGTIVDGEEAHPAATRALLKIMLFLSR